MMTAGGTCVLIVSRIRYSEGMMRMAKSSVDATAMWVAQPQEVGFSGLVGQGVAQLSVGHQVSGDE